MVMNQVNPLAQVTLDELRQRTSEKWRTYADDVLPLWVAEMDVLLAEPIADALVQAIRRGDTGYPTGTGYAEALRDFAADRWGWNGIDVGRTALVADVMIGVTEMLRLVTRPGEAVIVNCPVYPPFYSFVEHMDRRVVEAPLDPAARLDFETLAQAFEEATGSGRGAAYLLCSPHNPTGTVHTSVELEHVATLAELYGVRVVVDEIHAPLVLPGAEFVPYLSVPGSERAFSLMSASKGWNLAGLKAALAIAGPGAVTDFARLPAEVSDGGSHLGVIAHTVALRDGGAWLDALLDGLDRNRRLLADLLTEHLPLVRYRPPQATYLAWLDCRALGFDEGDLSDRAGVGVPTAEGAAAAFLKRARVAVNAGPAFGTGGEGHVRLNFGTSPTILTQALQRMGCVPSIRP
jgi:cystathionine beta-lyase